MMWMPNELGFEVGEHCNRMAMAFLVKATERTLIRRERVQGTEEIVGGLAWEGHMLCAEV